MGGPLATAHGLATKSLVLSNTHFSGRCGQKAGAKALAHRLLNALRQEFESNRLYIVYQPQVTLTDQRVIGVEALLRWRAEDGTFISPASFIPVAESSGLIVSLGEWVLRRSLSVLGELRAAASTGDGAVEPSSGAASPRAARSST